MKIGLKLDFANETVTIAGPNENWIGTALWAEFYGLLIAIKAEAPGQPRQLFEEELRTVGHWISRKQGSPGKEISRHFREQLHPKGLGDILLANKITQDWRLSEAVVCQIPMETLHLWLSNKGWRKADDVGAFVSWTKAAVESLIQLQGGETEKALETARAARDLAQVNSLTHRISTLLAARAVQRAGVDSDSETELGEEIDDPLYWGEGVTGTALHARWSAMEKYWSRDEHVKQEIPVISKIASALEGSGDLGGLAQVYNTLAVLSRRIGDIDSSLRFLMRGIPLFVASGDIINLQSALFNLGHSLSLIHKRDKTFEIVSVTIPLMLDRRIRQELNIGRDSAQCEVLLALVALDDRELEVANGYVKEIEKLVEKNQNSFDEGCLYRIKAKVSDATFRLNGGLNYKARELVVKQLKRAKVMFTKANRFDAAATIDREIVKVLEGKPLSGPAPLDSTIVRVELSK